MGIQGIETVVKGQRRMYCPECADTRPDVQVILEQADAEDHLRFSDDPREDEVCVACNRSIREVQVTEGVYRVKARITFEVEVDVEATSAMQARYAVDGTLVHTELRQNRQALETVLEENVPMTQRARVDDCFYELESVRLVVLPENEDEKK